MRTEPDSLALQRLRRAHQRSTILLDRAPDPLLSFDGHRLRALNRAARRMFDTDGLLLDPPVVLLNAVSRMAGEKRDTLVLERQGLAITFSLAMVDVVDDGSLDRLIWLIDIEADIREAEAAALHEMLDVMGHEIMNAVAPIASLSSTAGELLREGTTASRIQALDALGTLERRAASLLTFTEGYRELSRLPPPSMTDVSLLGVVGDIATLFETHWRSEIRLSLHHPSTDVLMRMDRAQIVQAIWALLQNAAEATLARSDGERLVRLSIHHDGNRMTFAIEDNGPGFSASAIRQVFQPFYTTKSNGSGIGLSLARDIFRAHGGDVTIDHTLARGARVLAKI